MYTIQEAFTKAVTGVMGQGGPSKIPPVNFTGSYSGMYRGPGGRKCAVGWLIDDAEYHLGLEGKRVMAIMDLASLRGLPGVFLLQMQAIHDSLPTTEWEKEFRLIAKHLGLVYPGDESAAEAAPTQHGKFWLEVSEAIYSNSGHFSASLPSPTFEPTFCVNYDEIFLKLPTPKPEPVPEPKPKLEAVAA